MNEISDLLALIYQVDLEAAPLIEEEISRILRERNQREARETPVPAVTDDVQPILPLPPRESCA